MMILEELQTTLGNWRNESNWALKSEILSFRTLSTDVPISIFYKMVEVLIRPLEIFLATFQEDRQKTHPEIWFRWCMRISQNFDTSISTNTALECIRIGRCRKSEHINHFHRARGGLSWPLIRNNRFKEASAAYPNLNQTVAGAPKEFFQKGVK